MAIGEHLRAAGSGINQTSFMFGALMFAYLFFVTVRGDLPKWLGLLGLAKSTGTTSAPSTPASGFAPLSLPQNANASGLPTLPQISPAGGLT